MMWKVDPLFGHHNLMPGNEVKRNFWRLNRCAEVPDSLKCNPDLCQWLLRSYVVSEAIANIVQMFDHGRQVVRLGER